MEGLTLLHNEALLKRKRAEEEVTATFEALFVGAIDECVTRWNCSKSNTSMRRGGTEPIMKSHLRMEPL